MSPRVAGMTRILLAVLFAALAAACTQTGAPPDPVAGTSDAETFKSEMDTEAKALLPDLVTSLAASINGMQATFYERSGFGLWDYTASGGVVWAVGHHDRVARRLGRRCSSSTTTPS